MSVSLSDILGGKFLVDKNAPKNWRVIIYLSVLALIMIGSSHSADQKVHKIAALQENVKELRSAHINSRLQLRKLRSETVIAKKMAKVGVYPSDIAPEKLIIKVRKQ